MAVERKKAFVLDLGEAVSEKMSNLKTAVLVDRYRREAAFQRQVLENALSYEAQKSYYQEMIEKENKKFAPDADYISELKSNISNFNKQIRWKKWRDDFNASFRDYQYGRKSAEEHLAYLENTYAATDDWEMKEDIMSQITEAEGNVREEYRSVIDAKLILAKNDGTVEALQKGISVAEGERAKAVLEKDEARRIAMDATVMVLQRDLRQAEIQDEEVDIDLKVFGGGDINDKLDWFYNKSQTASAEAMPFIVDNVKYDNEQQYWQRRLGSFITEEDGYFSIKETQLKNEIISLNNKFGTLSLDQLVDIRSKTTEVSEKAALQPYTERIKSFQQNVLLQALSLKTSSLQQKLQTDETREGIAKIGTEIQTIQSKIPEISLSSSFIDLELTYAAKQQSILSTKLGKYQTLRLEELQAISGDIDRAEEEGEISQEEFQALKSAVQSEINKINLYGTKLAMKEVSLLKFGFGSNMGALEAEFTADFPELTQPYSGMEQFKKVISPVTKEVIAGLEKEKKAVTELPPEPPTEVPEEPIPPVTPKAKPFKPAAHVVPSKESYRLYRVPGTNEVYELSDWQVPTPEAPGGYGTRKHIGSEKVFESMYGKEGWAQVKDVSKSELEKYQEFEAYK